MCLTPGSSLLITLFLSGQPELDSIIEDIKQFKQRIFLRYFLTGLTGEETRDYVLFRLAVAGIKEQLFTEDALNLVYGRSNGIPRRVNTICDLALLFGFPMRPLIEVVFSPTGSRLPRPQTRDLVETPVIHIRKVVKERGEE